MSSKDQCNQHSGSCDSIFDMARLAMCSRGPVLLSWYAIHLVAFPEITPVSTEKLFLIFLLRYRYTRWIKKLSYSYLGLVVQAFYLDIPWHLGAAFGYVSEEGDMWRGIYMLEYIRWYTGNIWRYKISIAVYNHHPFHLWYRPLKICAPSLRGEQSKISHPPTLLDTWGRDSGLGNVWFEDIWCV